MKQPYSSFRFESYVFDEIAKTLRLTYSLDQQVFFTEEILFAFDYAPFINRDALDRAFWGLFTMAGISYFKTCMPPQMVFSSGKLNEKQKGFFERTYLNGLGQFFFENDIDPTGKISFPAVIGKASTSVEIQDLKGSLVAFGGGKDSITTCAILKQNGTEFETWTVGDYDFFEPALKELETTHRKIIRKLSPNLFTLNGQGAYNGHIPITAVNSFIGICAAILLGRKHVIFSNESSSREENTAHHGLSINHQYSKTLDFEKDFQSYIKEFISPSLSYFSFLRPLSELKISEIFCENFFDQYRHKFSSCNLNFKINKSHKNLAWCGECAKCASTFGLFSPFLPKEKLVALFNGKDLFADPTLRETYNSLLGISGIKPFECVGEIIEMRKACALARKNGFEFSLAQFPFEEPHFDYQKFESHAMPQDFELVLKTFLTKHAYNYDI
jgi:hypothetical protein